MGAGYSKPELTLPRRTRTISIPADAKENRDAGKVFIVTEVDAVTAEEWGLRAIMAIGTGGIVVPPELANAGLFGVVLVGYQALMGAREDAVLPLWREMLPACVKLRHAQTKDHATEEPFHRFMVEEVSTLLALRQAVMEIHTGFTLAELTSRFATVSSALQQQQDSLITPTSPPS